MTLPSGTVDVQLTEAEADAFLKQIATQYNRLLAETKALDAALAQSRQHVLTGPVFYQQSRDRNLSTQELYEQLFAAQIRQKGQSQDLLQRIRDSLSYIRPRTSFATVDALKARYGFGDLGLTALAAFLIVTIGAMYVSHQLGSTTKVGIAEGRQALDAMIGITKETRLMREAMGGDLCAKYTAAALATGVPQKEIDAWCERIKQLAKPVTSGGAPWSWVIIAGLVAAVGGFFGGRVTK
jgi:hypothetical protein